MLRSEYLLNTCLNTSVLSEYLVCLNTYLCLNTSEIV